MVWSSKQIRPLVKNPIRSLSTKTLTSSEKLSVKYHDIFDYPMTLGELVRWKAGSMIVIDDADAIEVNNQNGLHFLKGRSGLLLKKSVRERASIKKMKIAKKAAGLLSRIPTVKMVGVSGALAMRNAADESDIDLLIICAKGSLWTTRAISWLVLKLFGQKIRKPKESDEKDKLCLNMWLDESDLVWRKRNIFTAHEIAQVIPIIDKGGYYQAFISKNKWAKDYWPNAAKYSNKTVYTDYYGVTAQLIYSFIKLVEPISFYLQRRYMREKVTKEVIKKNRAVFHPNDLSVIVVSRMGLW